MNLPYAQILETIAVVGVVIGLRLLIGSTLNRIARQFKFETGRKKMIAKVLNLSLNLVAGIILFGIWGVNQQDLAVYLASVLTVLGVAFFAQWSHLSNITAGVILFFSHPAKIGDTITIKEKDAPIEGTISDIGLFFLTIKTTSQEKILIANTVFLQKMVSVKLEE